MMAACSPPALGPPSGSDGGEVDLATATAQDLSFSSDDAGSTDSCTVSGAPGQCLMVAACMAMPNHTPYSGHCPGPAAIQCCIVTPSVASNPPIPTGYRLMTQAEVTTDMTTWAVAILHDPVTYPMFATATKTFGTVTVLARVEWHPPDFQNHVIHRGVTLYVPI